MSAMRFAHGPLVALLLLAGTALSAVAQDSHRNERKGYWMSAGFGFAHNDLACTGCAYNAPNDPWRGGTGGGAVYAGGSALSQQLLLGLELNVTGVGREERDAMIFLLMFVAQYYPFRTGNLHLTGGVGPASIILGQKGGSAEANGAAALLGLGYDLRFWRSLALAPYFTHTVTNIRPGVRISGNAGAVTRIQNSRITQVGTALRWY